MKVRGSGRDHKRRRQPPIKPGWKFPIRTAIEAIAHATTHEDKSAQTLSKLGKNRREYMNRLVAEIKGGKHK